MQKSIKRMITTISALSLVTIALMLSGCGGGGGGLSSQVVSGTAATGAPLAGQVTLKDSSTTPQTRTTVIGGDGSFAIDVTGMQAPFILEASGNVSGNSVKLHSYADGTGTANINPLSDVIVAGAAGDSDASHTYDTADSVKLHKIGTNLSHTIAVLLAKLQPLLQQYNAQNTNPITSEYIANHLGLDGMFDNVKITVANGVVTIINARTTAVIYTGNVTDIADGKFNTGTLPSTPAVPAVPAGLTASGGAGQIALSWSAVSGATSYNVYYASASGVTVASGTKVTSTTTSYTQTGLAASTTVYYVVTAVNSSGESAASAQVSATTNAAVPTPTVPAAPTGISAAGGTNQVTISWPAVTGATSYNIYWSATTGVTKTSGTKITNATSPAVQTGLTAGTTYFYIVTAVNGTGESAASVQVSAATLSPVPTPTAPAAPTGVNAAGGTNQVSLSWTASTGATSYNIYWSTTSGVSKTSGTKITGATSPYVQTGLTAGTTYYYVITAMNSVGESSASTQVSAATAAPLPAVPAAPAGVTATGGTNQVSLSWPAVSGATSYNLYYSTTSGVTTANGTRISSVTSPYVQTGLAAGTTYYYVLTAVNGAGEGAASTQASAATAAAAPAFDALTYFNSVCLGCHGSLGVRTAAQITSAISSIGSMKSLSTLTAAQIAAIAAVSH